MNLIYRQPDIGAVTVSTGRRVCPDTPGCLSVLDHVFPHQLPWALQSAEAAPFRLSSTLLLGNKGGDGPHRAGDDGLIMIMPTHKFHGMQCNALQCLQAPAPGISLPPKEYGIHVRHNPVFVVETEEG